MKNIDKIIVHCADTPEGAYYDIDDIRKWHVQENGWSDVGYHYIILLDGTIQKGREDNVQGAHCKGQNKNSLGICYIGGAKGVDTRTTAQKASLVHLIATLKRLHKGTNVYGHNNFSTKKCPNFNAKTEYIGV